MYTDDLPQILFGFVMYSSLTWGIGCVGGFLEYCISKLISDYKVPSCVCDCERSVGFTEMSTMIVKTALFCCRSH